MNNEPKTRHSQLLPQLRYSLSLLYVGRFLVGLTPDSGSSDDLLEQIDEHIETVTDELAATELLHEAAMLAGDVLPETPSESTI